MGRQYLQRLLRPFCQVQENEVFSTLLMFSYSFLAMSAYNIIQPIQRSLFIERLGSNKIPYVQLAAGLFIGLIMTGYAWLMSRLPRRWALPITQAGIVILLFTFWILFRSLPGQNWVAVGFYILGLILGILLISQFWTLANVVYDPRQAKRLFGFIGGGASLGGMLGALVTWFSKEVGTVNLLLVSAALMLACMAVVVIVVIRENVGREAKVITVEESKGVGARRALELLRGSKHLRLIALVISFGAIGAAILDQQLNMATDFFKGQQGADAMSIFLGKVRFYMSAIAFIFQIGLTSRIHRYLGVGFALLLLPMGLGSTAAIILLNFAIWSPTLGRLLDQSVRYTIDKTTREILYMPLPNEIKYEAKPFVDVTVDRFAKGMTAVLLLILISPWGLELRWDKLSYVSAAIVLVWVFVALRAKRGYQLAFRHSIETREMKPADMRLTVADLSTIETLIQELASPDDRRVLYAIDVLESLDKRNLITPLLLYHESPAVKVRALGLLGATLAAESARWLPAIERMMTDEDPGVRAAAVGALAHMRDEHATDMVRPYLQDKNPRIAMTAAMVLSDSSHEEDVVAAEEVLRGIVSDARDSAAQARREFAVALRHAPNPHFRRLLIPLLMDANPDVAEEAMRTVRHLETAEFIFIPTLISLLRNRKLKSSAREMLVGYGEQALAILGHFLRDPEEDIWVRRHIPGTIALIPCQKAMEILVDALEEQDGFLCFKVLAAIERLHRSNPDLSFNRESIESRALREGSHCLGYRSFYRHLFEQEKLPKDSLLACALREKMARGRDRIYRLLGLIYPWKDIEAARWAIEHGDSRTRSSALEYLDNVLKGALRKKLMPVLEEPGAGEELRGQLQSMEESVTRMIQDPDPVLAATAVLFAWQIKLGSLNAELEQVLASRDARDWCVFEAASWVSAAFRLQEARRRALWMEPLPIVEAADRLRALPLFASLSVDGLFRLVVAGNQERFESSQILYQDGTVPETIHLLLDGHVSCKPTTGDGRDLEAPAALAFQEVLESRPARETVRTAGTAVCLALSGEECRNLLADDTELVRGLFTTLCCADDGKPAGLVFKGEPAEGTAGVSKADLKPIEKVLVLKNLPVFSDVTADEMLFLAGIATEVPLRKGAVLFGEAQPPALYALVSGEMSLESSAGEAALLAGPNDAVGVQQTLAGLSLGRIARVVSGGTALRIDREDLFDVLAQRPDLLRQLFSALSRARAARLAIASA